jgi:anti-sigma factor RsiW
MKGIVRIMDTTRSPLNPEDGLELGRWIDGELEPEKSAAVEQRLAADAALHREAEVLSELEGLLEQWPVSGEAPDVRAAVLARIERDSLEDVGWRILPRSWRAPAWAAAWAACGVLLAFGILGVVDYAATPANGMVITLAESDLTFGDFFSDALDGPEATVDSLADWLLEPEDAE